MKNINPQKSNSLTIDICKFLGAYMVVAIHTTPWNLFGTGAFNTVYLNFIYCAVPCFFMASGYLLAGRMEWPLTAKDNLPKVAHAFFKMLKLYLLWSLAYLPLAIFDYRRSGLGVREAAIRYIKGLVFSGEHYGSWMLWYMISAIYALGIIYLLLKIKVNPWAITALGLVFILCGAALDMLSGTTNDISPAINFIRKLMWATTGNGKVFRGLFYISFGMLLTKIKIPVWADVLITLCGFAGCVAFNKYTGFFCYSLRRRTFRNNNIRESAVCFGQKNTQTREHDNIFHASLCLYDSRAALRTAQRKTGIFNSCPDNNGDRFCIYCNLRPHKTKKMR
ncbi:MAG: acyltransferase family protein [Acutalibacteraceae bacterium]